MSQPLNNRDLMDDLEQRVTRAEDAIARDFERALLIIGILIGTCIKHGIELPTEVRDWVRERY